MLELLWLLLTTILAWVRPRQDLVFENLLLRHPLAVLTRPTRGRPLRSRDEALWVLARRFCAGWREHLRIVTPETVVRWHRQGWRQIIEATPWKQKPRHLLRDQDAVYGRDVRQRARRIGIDAIATSIRSPRANAVVERVIGTLRRECLDHLIVLDEQHLASLLAELARYYNRERPHRTLDLQPPEPRARPASGPMRSRPALNGLHHVYERVA